MDYQISKEVAHQIAVGLYRNVGAVVFAAIQDKPDDYERFKEDYLAKLTAQSATPDKRHYTRNRQNIQR